jgi:hypothetical protein
MTSVIHGYCTLCRSRCATLNTVDGDQLISVEPDPSHPTGKAIRMKGRAAPEIVHSPHRVFYPMRRTRERTALAMCQVSVSALTSEIRRMTNTDETYHCATLLDASGDATLISGTWPAAVESADILSCELAPKSVRARNSDERTRPRGICRRVLPDRTGTC